jgi:type I restriction enzyme S subunit
MSRKLPPHWKTKQLGGLTRIFDGTHQTPKYVENGVPFYSVEHLTANSFNKTKFISEKVYQEECKRVALEEGDILMTRIGDIGTAKYIDWDVKASFYVSLALIKSPDGIDSQFLTHYINGNQFQKELWRRTIHVAFPKKINLGEIGKCLVVTPPFPEQKKIAAILSSVDEAINATQAVIDQTRKVKEGLLQDLLTRGIGHTRFKQTEIGEIPEEWEVATISSCCEKVIDCKNRTPPYTDEGYPVIRTPNVRNGKLIQQSILRTDYLSYLEWTKRGTPQHKDLVITREAPMGEACLIPENVQPCLGQRMMLFRTNSQKCIPEFLLAVVLAPQTQKRLTRMVGGSTVGHIRVGDLKSLLVPVPPVSEQKIIAETIHSFDAKAEETKLAQLQQTKRGLMQDLLSGDVRVAV